MDYSKINKDLLQSHSEIIADLCFTRMYGGALYYMEIIKKLTSFDKS